MKKIIFLALTLSSLFILTACGSYDLTSKSILTDVTIKEIDSHMVGKVEEFTITFKKDGKEQTLDLNNPKESKIKEEIDTIKKTSLIIESKEELLFDLVLDGKNVIVVTLSKNRK